jgi:hypothetical protein
MRFHRSLLLAALVASSAHAEAAGNNHMSADQQYVNSLTQQELLESNKRQDQKQRSSIASELAAIGTSMKNMPVDSPQSVVAIEQEVDRIGQQIKSEATAQETKATPTQARATLEKVKVAVKSAASKLNFIRLAEAQGRPMATSPMRQRTRLCIQEVKSTLNDLYTLSMDQTAEITGMTGFDTPALLAAGMNKQTFLSSTCRKTLHVCAGTALVHGSNV